jgi:hypothetical protein
MEYVLMDLERTLGYNTPCFWKANNHGYTYQLKQAGLYPKKMAESMVENDHDHTTVMIHINTISRILDLELVSDEQ